MNDYIKKYNDIDVGDIVRIREWDDMKTEFGLDRDGDIFIPADSAFFIRSTRHLCNQEFKVEKVINHRGLTRIKVQGVQYYLTPSMLAEIEKDSELVFALDDINKYLESVLVSKDR